MRKLLALLITTTFLASTAYSYVPLSNSQNNLGSFRQGATRGMFYEEIDILSASPVNLLDFSGNSLYTNWGNARYFNDPLIAAVPTGLTADRALTYNSAGRNQFFNFGLTGNPLTYLGVEDSRSGFVYQNWGAKAVTFDLDNDATTGDGFGLDSEGKWSNTNETVLGNDLVIDRTRQTSSDLKFHDNRTFTQWNTGIAMKGLLLSDLIAGFSIANQADANIRTMGGSKTYRDLYVTDAGALAVGMLAGMRTGDSYTATFADKTFDLNSTNMTDMLFQGRYPLLGMIVDGGIGLRFQSSNNPTNVDAGQAVSVSGSEDVLIGVAQYFHTGSVITDRANLDYNAVGAGFGLIGDIAARAGIFTTAGGGANAATTIISDKRAGSGPILRLEALKEWGKVNLTGVFNLSSVKQNIDGSMTEREYVATRLQISATQIDNFVDTDFTRTFKLTGDNKLSAMDVGGKVEFNALDNIKLAFGGFIQKDSNITDTNTTTNSTELVSYDDGLAAGTPYVIVTAASQPGTGPGEGTWKRTISQSIADKNEETRTNYVVPVGTEIKLSKKWTFAAGTQYIMQKVTTKVTAVTNMEKTITEQTPVGAATVITRDETINPSETVSTIYTEAHMVQYSYGIRFDVNQSLTISANAFLDTNVGGAFTDLNTFRNLAMQAVFRF